MKSVSRIFSILWAITILASVPACKFLAPDDSANELSRRDVIGIYAGGIDENEFLDRIDSKPKAVPAMANTFALDLRDGELFYKIETQKGVRRVTEILLPTTADVPAELRTYAESFRKTPTANSPAAKNPQKKTELLTVALDADGQLFFNGVKISEGAAAEEFSRIGELDLSKQPKVVLKANPAVDVATLARIINSAENSGLKRFSFSGQ